MSRGKYDFLWKWLASKLFFIVLGSLIVVAMIVGTVIVEINIFQTLWFNSLMALLLLSLIVCTIMRFRWKINFAGPLVIHISFAIIIAGMMVSGVFSEKGHMQIFQGGMSNSFSIRRPYRGIKALDFNVHLERFDIVYYDQAVNSIHECEHEHEPELAVKNYQSKVVVTENGREAIRRTIEVNSPLKYGGYTFYQTGYDQNFLQYSVLSVVYDPGVPIIYTGLAFLALGFIFQFYAKPLITKRRKKLCN